MLPEIAPERVAAKLAADEGAADVSGAVREILLEVRRSGDAALRRLTRRFDRVAIASIRLSGKELRGGRRVPAALREDMKLAYERVLRFHRATADESRMVKEENGGFLGRLVRPLRRVGIYVPGGSAPLFSTLLMAAAAARAAGVREICVATPPPVADVILAAAEIAGIDEIVRVGGAQAVAALAYGTRSVRPVDKIVGPGNRYVAEAKRQVFGRVGIDSIAGPSEIVILADETADPSLVAADLLAQAEHDEYARPVLLTTSRALVSAVRRALAAQLADLPRRPIAEVSLAARGLVSVVRTRDRLVALSNEIAPEHLEIMTRDPWRLVEKVTAAGAIFVGADAPEVLGDYVAGPNHVLPTSGTARFSPPLSARDFVAVSTVQWFPRAAAGRLAGPAARLARAEGLEAHARSAAARDRR